MHTSSRGGSRGIVFSSATAAPGPSIASSSRGKATAAGTKRSFPTVAASTAPAMGGVFEPARRSPPVQHLRRGGNLVAAAAAEVIDLTELDASPLRGDGGGLCGGCGSGSSMGRDGGDGVKRSRGGGGGIAGGNESNNSGRGGADNASAFASLTMSSAVSQSHRYPLPDLFNCSRWRVQSPTGSGSGPWAAVEILTASRKYQHDQRPARQPPVAVRCAPASTTLCKPPTTHARPVAGTGLVGGGTHRWLPVFRGGVRWMTRLFV